MIINTYIIVKNDDISNNLKIKNITKILISNDIIQYNFIIKNILENDILKIHLECIDESKQNKIDFTIILDIDCEFTSYFDIQINNVIKQISLNDKINVFYGKVNELDINNIVSVYNYYNEENKSDKEYYFQLSNSYAYDFVIYKSNIYDLILEQENNFVNRVTGFTVYPFLLNHSIDIENLVNKYIESLDEKEIVIANNLYRKVKTDTEKKIKLVIMTTAITRPDLHNSSIKIFYEKYYLNNQREKQEDIDKKFEIIHIINIDWPEKLKNYSTVEETIVNFNKIIPENVTKIYIKTEEPSFLNAYKNIMRKILELNLLSDENFYWWFEDDWVCKEELKFFNILELLKIFWFSAMTMTRNSQLGSFRAGPIMNGAFFINYYNIEQMCFMNDTCDPERQVVRYLSAKSSIYFDENKSIVRKLNNDNEKIIHLVLIYFDKSYNKINLDFGYTFYKDKFNESIQLISHILKITNYDYDSIEYVSCHQDTIINLSDKNNYSKITINEFKNMISSSSIVYYTIKPYTFEDIGRDYAKEHNLIKAWNKIGDKLTYS